MEFGYTLKSDKAFDEVVEQLEKSSAENQFRVLISHDVQGTLAEKGFERKPLKIIEVCNAGFAHDALQKEIDVALFMPCKFVVYTEEDKTVVTLGRPSMISEIMPQAGLNDLASDVEQRLIKIMKEVV